MQWTGDCTKALTSTKERGDKKALKSLKKKQASLLSFCVVLMSLIFFCRCLRRLHIRCSLSDPFAFLLRSSGRGARWASLPNSGLSAPSLLLFHVSLPFSLFPSSCLLSWSTKHCHRLVSLSCFNDSSFTKHDERSFQIPSSCLQISMLNKFSEMIRGNLTKIQRQKIVALVTIEVHARDVIEKMIKSGCGDVTAFEWLSQLRLYWDKVCVITVVFI